MARHTSKIAVQSFAPLACNGLKDLEVIRLFLAVFMMRAYDWEMRRMMALGWPGIQHDPPMMGKITRWS